MPAHRSSPCPAFLPAVLAPALLTALLTAGLPRTARAQTVDSAQPADVGAALGVHNALREDVGAPPLAWSDDLARHAARYARQLAARNCHLRHDNSPQGENLYAAWGSPELLPKRPLEDASLAWGEEISAYHGQPIGQGRFADYGHYTQMIWEDTREVGLASARGRDGCIVVVARYLPAGNVIGRRPTD